MERDILHLYQQAQVGPLEAKEVHWLENQVNEYPYFALPRIILARHQFQRDTNVQSRQLLEGAAYSLDRGHFRNYLYMSLPTVPTVPVVPAVPTASAISAAPEEAVGKETTAKEALPGTEAGTDSTANDSVFPEKEKVGKINWFLNTKIQIKTSKYLGQYGKIKASLYSPGTLGDAQAKAAPQSDQVPGAIDPQQDTNPAEAKSEEVEKKSGKSEAKSEEEETKSGKSEAKSNESEAKSEEINPESLKTKEEKAKAVEALLASRRAKKSKTDPEQGNKEKAEDYEIGAFSSFSFVDDVDAGEEGDGEVNTLVQAGEIVSLQSPENSDTGYSELVIESDDRRLEVLVTPEELETYFKGKLPAHPSRRAHGLSATDDEPVHLQFDFLVSEEELEDEEEQQKSDVNPRTEVQNLNAKSSPELVSNASVSDAEKDEERERQLIHKFIEHEPSITRGGHVHAPAGDLAKESLKDEDDWVTETLAKVFVMQGNNARAIRIYKKLALLFPEKRAYFDVQISKLKR